MGLLYADFLQSILNHSILRTLYNPFVTPYNTAIQVVYSYTIVFSYSSTHEGLENRTKRYSVGFPFILPLFIFLLFSAPFSSTYSCLATATHLYFIALGSTVRVNLVVTHWCRSLWERVDNSVWECFPLLCKARTWKQGGGGGNKER